jgi:LysM repeat protein
VKPGETLVSIARRYGVAEEDMKRWNPGVRASAGRRLAVEMRAPPAAKTKKKVSRKTRS